MTDIIKLLDVGEIQAALNTLTRKKGINLKFICDNANLNYSLIQKYANDVIQDIGANKKQILVETIKGLYQ